MSRYNDLPTFEEFMASREKNDKVSETSIKENEILSDEDKEMKKIVKEVMMVGKPIEEQILYKLDNIEQKLFEIEHLNASNIRSEMDENTAKQEIEKLKKNNSKEQDNCHTEVLLIVLTDFRYMIQLTNYEEIQEESLNNYKSCLRSFENRLDEVIKKIRYEQYDKEAALKELLADIDKLEHSLDNKVELNNDINRTDEEKLAYIQELAASMNNQKIFKKYTVFVSYLKNQLQDLNKLINSI